MKHFKSLFIGLVLFGVLTAGVIYVNAVQGGPGKNNDINNTQRWSFATTTNSYQLSFGEDTLANHFWLYGDTSGNGSVIPANGTGTWTVSTTLLVKDTLTVGDELDVNGSSTSTFAQSINIETALGCYAVNGVCLESVDLTSVDSDVLPDGNNTRDLGAGGSAWADIYSSSTIYATGLSVKSTSTIWISMYDFSNEDASYNTANLYFYPTATGDRIRSNFKVPYQIGGRTVHINQITFYGRANDSAADFDFSLIAQDLDNTISFPFSEADIWNGESGASLSTAIIGAGEDFDMENKPYHVSLNINNTSTATDVWFYGMKVDIEW